MTLYLTVVGQCFWFPLVYLLLSLAQFLSAMTLTPALQCGPLQQLENQHLHFLRLNKAAVYICLSAHMDVLIFYVLMEWVGRLFLEF